DVGGLADDREPLAGLELADDRRAAVDRRPGGQGHPAGPPEPLVDRLELADDRQGRLDRPARGVLVRDREAEARLEPLRRRDRDGPALADHGLAAALAELDQELVLVLRVERRE